MSKNKRKFIVESNKRIGSFYSVQPITRADIGSDEVSVFDEKKKWNDEKFCLEAVKQDGLALQYVKNQTEKICLEAVKENGDALEFVKNQTLQICGEDVNRSLWANSFIKDLNHREYWDGFIAYNWDCYNIAYSKSKNRRLYSLVLKGDEKFLPINVDQEYEPHVPGFHD